LLIEPTSNTPSKTSTTWVGEAKFGSLSGRNQQYNSPLKNEEPDFLPTCSPSRVHDCARGTFSWTVVDNRGGRRLFPPSLRLNNYLAN
jgi:hypothetical protein